MLYLYLVTVGVMATLTTVWATVQMARGRMFSDASPEDDLLGSRAGCGTCARHVHCDATSEH